MYTVRKRIEISASHSLKLSYESKCENLHGHNWIIVVWCRAKQLNDDGMVVDFTHIKQKIQEQLDHRNLNEVLSLIRQRRIWQDGFVNKFRLVLK